MSDSTDKLRILLIDDDRQLMEIVADYLGQMLHAIIFTADSVPAAVVQIDDQAPLDVLVSDYQIPPHTALDLAQYLKQAEVDIPLILHSGFDGIDESHFKGSNYLGLIQKPASRELVRLISDHFPQAKKR